MTPDDIRRLYRREPFQPYELELTDGRVLPVSERGHITISHSGNRITWADVIDNFEIIDLDQIKSYRLLTPQAQAG
jgi:hypothetical protein